MSCSTAKLVCAILLKYWYRYHTVGYVVLCFVVRGYIQIYKEAEQFLFQEVGNQIYKVLGGSGSITQVLDSELALGYTN